MVSIAHKHVDVPVIQTVEKIVDVPVVKQVDVPHVTTIEKVVEVPHVQVVEKVIEVPMAGETIQGHQHTVTVPLPPVRHQAPPEHVHETVVGPDLPAEHGGQMIHSAPAPAITAAPVTTYQHAVPAPTMVTHTQPAGGSVSIVGQPAVGGGSVSIPAVATGGSVSVPVTTQAAPVHMIQHEAPVVTYGAPTTVMHQTPYSVMSHEAPVTVMNHDGITYGAPTTVMHQAAPVTHGIVPSTTYGAVPLTTYAVQ